jgi:hypothetical protein
MLNFKRTVLCQLLVLCCLLTAPLSAYAVGNISLTSSNGTFFTVMARGFDAPGGFHLTVTYDPTRLSIPANSRVVAGSLASGGLFVANTNFTGSLQLIVVSTNAMKGSGPIATISFDRSGDSTGNLGVSGYVVNTNTAYLPATFSGWSDGGGSGNITAGGTDTTTTSTATTQTTTSTGTSTGTPVVGGTLTMPSDDTGMREHKDVPGQPAPVPPPLVPQEPHDGDLPPSENPEASAAPEAPVATKKAQEEPLRPVQSVLEKFRLFTGDKTPATYLALFEAGQGGAFSQNPAVGIADGKSSVKITIFKVAGDRAPNFAFNHAKYLSLRQTGDGEWQVEVVPEKGAVRASISMVTEASQQEIPLTVAPPADVDLDKSGSVTEADFQLFLKTRGTDDAPKFDLNGDGKRDYQDDYIFTANYLVKAGNVKKDLPPAPKKAP